MVTRTSTTRTTRSLCEQSADTTAVSRCHTPFTFTELAQAYFDCRKSKRNSRTALEFEQNLERNLMQLYCELLDGSYRIGQSICFVITHPKPREVWAAEFRDRIVHHLVYNQIAPAIESSFIADSCACIKGRGTLYGAVRLENKIRSLTQNWQKEAFYLKCDLANFFVSIDKNIVAKILMEKIENDWWKQLTLKILHHDARLNYSLRCSRHKLNKVPLHKRLTSQPSHLGLPIGNLSSQFFANILLNELDQYCKHKLKVKHYVRYVDDFILLHESTTQLNCWHQQIKGYLPQLGATLNDSKTIIQPIARGVDFVGQVIKPWRRTIRKKTKNHACDNVLHAPASSLTKTANSYFGLARQASHSHQMRRQIAKNIFLRGKAVDSHLTKTYGK